MTGSGSNGRRVPCRVLVAEDEWLIAEFIDSAVAGTQFQITGRAVNVAEAIALIHGSAFDAAILDFNLDGQPSRAVADCLDAHRIPFLVITGNSADRVAKTFGCVRLLPKPFLPHVLLHQLEQLTSGQPAAKPE